MNEAELKNCSTNQTKSRRSWLPLANLQSKIINQKSKMFHMVASTI